MAGDWIKMRGNLWDDPRVAAIVDATESSEAAVIGGLYWLWAAADQHTEDGFMPGLSMRQIDRKTGVSGLGAALSAVGWIAEADGGILIARFEEHNGASAKRRCMEAKRKGSVRKVSASHADKLQTKSGHHAELEKEIKKELTEPKGSGAAAPVDPIWGAGLAFLIRKGLPEKSARSLLGRLRQTCGEPETACLLHAAEAQDISNPAPWLLAGAAKRKARAGPAPSKTLSAIQTLQGLKHANVDSRFDSGRADPLALPLAGPDSGG